MTKSNQDSSSSSNKSSSNNEENPTEKSETENPSSQITPEEMYASNSPIVGLRGSENFGLAVFKGDKFAGILNAGETLCHSIITDEADSFVANVPSPNGATKPIVMDLYKKSNCKINIDTSAEKPIITVDIFVASRLSSMTQGLNYTDSQTLESIKEATEKHLEKEISDYLYKTSKEFKADISNFYAIAKRNFLTQEDLDNYNWEEKYPSAEFNVNVYADVISSLLIQSF